MKITRDEADLIEAIRKTGASADIVKANIEALAAGQVDIKKYLCSHCVSVTEKILLFRRTINSGRSA